MYGNQAGAPIVPRKRDLPLTPAQNAGAKTCAAGAMIGKTVETLFWQLLSMPTTF